MKAESTAMATQANRGIPDLVSDAVGQLAKLVSNEFELARAELGKSQPGRPGGGHDWCRCDNPDACAGDASVCSRRCLDARRDLRSSLPIC